MSKKQLELNVQGMTCDSCAVHVEKAIRGIPGVTEVRVPGWKSGRALVTVTDKVNPSALTEAVAQAGYRAEIQTSEIFRDIRGLELPKRDGGGFDLMVIGGGSAGFAAAIKGSELGYRVALVEAGTIGGTCVNVGCVPSKALIRAMEQYHRAGETRFRGVHTTKGALDWAQVVSHKDELVAELRQAKYRDVLAGYPNVAYIEGRAQMQKTSKGSKDLLAVEINGQAYAPGKIILATGASPWAAPIPGLDEAGYLTSTTAMELTELPRSMIVLGANAVGLEQAQIFARAGVRVTVLELLPRIAPFEDEDVSAALQGCLEEEGLRVATGFQTSNVEKREERYFLTGTRDGGEMVFDAEQLLVATGRRPNTRGLGLEEAGIELGKRGEVVVDENLRTANPDVYAAGDVTGRDMFVYVAAYAGGLAAENALSGANRRYETAYIPRVTFTDPAVASAGLTEAQAREQGYEVKTSLLPMEYVPRALAARDTRGLVKLVADAATDKLLGAHILAPEAGEMIQVTVLAIRFGLTVADLRETLFPYLTNAEALKLAALGFEKDVSKLSCCAG